MMQKDSEHVLCMYIITNYLFFLFLDWCCCCIVLCAITVGGAGGGGDWVATTTDVAGVVVGVSTCWMFRFHLLLVLFREAPPPEWWCGSK